MQLFEGSLVYMVWTWRGGPMRLERFIEEYSDKAFQFAFHLCGDVEEAKELVQEAFFRAMRKWDLYDTSQPLENWYLSILRNLYFDSLKRYERRRTVSLDAPRIAEDGGAETYAEVLADAREEALLDRLERREAQEDVRAVLESLDPHSRAILTLCDIQGMSYDRMAEVLDCPSGTLRSRISRARAAFKKKLLERKGEVVSS